MGCVAKILRRKMVWISRSWEYGAIVPPENQENFIDFIVENQGV